VNNKVKPINGAVIGIDDLAKKFARFYVGISGISQRCLRNTYKCKFILTELDSTNLRFTEMLDIALDATLNDS